MLVIPLLLLAFMLLMGRVEEPLRRQAPERDVEEFLDEANPQELETFVSEGTDSALKRFRNRLSVRRRKRLNGGLRPSAGADNPGTKH